MAAPKPVTWRALEAQIRRECASAGLRGRVKVVPWAAAAEKGAAARDHAYVYPESLEFHFSAKTLALPQAHRDAIVAHEIGHCLAQAHWGSSTEPEADAAAAKWLGTKICYDHGWPGKGLQVVCSRARASNPGVKQSDIDDAIEYAQESLEADLDRDAVQVSAVRTIAVDDLYSYDDVSAWSEWRRGDLADLDPAERYAELKSFRGKDFADRATRWIESGRVPPIVLLDLEEGMAIGDGRGRTSVALGMGWPTVDAVVVTRRQENPSSFATYDEALAWIYERAKHYGGKNNFYASDEYRQAVPEIQALYRTDRAGYAASKQSQLQQSSLASGDRVGRFAPGAFGGGEEIHGTIVMRKGEPWVKFDEKTAVSIEGRVSTRSSVRWSPAWRKLERNPSGFRRGTPPQALADYLKASEIHARYRGVYFLGDTQIASSRTTPAPSELPLGTWQYDDAFKGIYGHEIDELVEIDPRLLEPGEFEWPTYQRDLRRNGKLEDAERYAEWLAAGNVMPPATVVETERGTLRVVDGHRRTAAADMAGVPVRAWISWLAPHPEGLIDSNGRPMHVGLTYEIATGRQRNPRQQRISRRITM